MDRQQLASTFTGSPSPPRVGIEVECAVLSASTAGSVRYHGLNGLAGLLWRIAEALDGVLIFEMSDSYPMGIQLPNGSFVGLEPGGALEYASAPCLNLTDLASETHRDLLSIAKVCSDHGIALVPGGNNPFAASKELNWIPSQKVHILRAHYNALGMGKSADFAMALNLSTQTTLDYVSQNDLCEQLHMQTVASPVIKAIFVNSPFHRGRSTGYQSHRLYLWGTAEPVRSGALPPALDPALSVGDLVDWLVRFPMIYRIQQARHVAGGPENFANLMRAGGHSDGSALTFQDWRTHINQVWTDARPRSTIELRGADGPPWPHIFAAPALWVGMSYHRPTRRAISELFTGITESEHAAGTFQAARHGLFGRYAGERLQDLAAEILRLARSGLRDLINEGSEHRDSLAYLAILDEIVSECETFALRSLREWGDKIAKPCDYISRYQIL